MGTHEFVKGKSTHTALFVFLNKISNNGQKSASLFMDLSKTFDIVNHKLLLAIYSFRGRMYIWHT